MPSFDTMPEPLEAHRNGERRPDMAIFQAEIASLIAERKPEMTEAERPLDIGMKDLLRVNPQELTEDDAKMWEMVRDNPSLVTPEEFLKYVENTDASSNSSRIAFRAALGNELMMHWAKNSIKKHS